MANNFVVVHEAGKSSVIDWRDFKHPGIKLSIKGEMNVVKIHLPLNAQDSSISIESNGSSFEIGSSIRLITIGVSIKNGNHQHVRIGKDFSCGGAIFISQETYSKIFIGDDCMFSTDITVMAGDGHAINPIFEDELIKNWGGDIYLADHVWVGRSVKVARGAFVSKNSIIAFASVVTKKFDQENISIGGSPAKMISTGIQWNRRAQHAYHKDKLEKYGLTNFSGDAKELVSIISSDSDKAWVDFFSKNYELQNIWLKTELNDCKNKFEKDYSNLGLLKYLESIYETLGRDDDRFDIFEKYFSATKNPDLWALMKWSEILYARGDFSRAVDFAIRSQNGDSYSWLKCCSKFLIECGKSDIVFNVAVKAIDSEKRDPDFIYNLVVNILLEDKNYSLAEIYLKRFLKLRPSNLVITRKLVETLVNQSKFDEATSICLDVLKVAPQQMWAYFNISIAFEKKLDFHNSIFWTEKALSIQPSHSGWLKRLDFLKKILCK